MPSKLSGLEYSRRQCVQFVHAADHPIALADIGRGAGLAFDGDFNGRAQVLGRDAADRSGERRGEQRHLALRRRLFENAFDGIDEAHAQHFIGLVQDQQRQPRKLQGAAVHVIDDPARRAHDHMHAAPQGIELRLVALAAVDRQYVKSLQMRGIFQKCLGHLQGEFTGGHQHQDLGLVFGQIDARQCR